MLLGISNFLGALLIAGTFDIPEVALSEIQPRCSRGVAEVQPRCSRGVAEVRGFDFPRSGRLYDWRFTINE